MDGGGIFRARFFETESGQAPVRHWLLGLSPQDRKAIGDDIRTAEFGWPVGMPLCRPVAGHRGLWEIRTTLAGNRIARMLFCAHDANLVLLHGFIKKTRRAPKRELDLAVRRMRGLR